VAEDVDLWQAISVEVEKYAEQLCDCQLLRDL
jgi:hypothetical protein